MRAKTFIYKHLLPADRRRQGRQRLPRGTCTSLSDHARRDGVDRRFQPDPHEPFLLRRRPDDILTDSVVRRIESKPGLVMWEWHALGHVPVTESTTPAEVRYPWDDVHVNPWSVGASGHVLLSARNTWDGRTTSTCAPVLPLAPGWKSSASRPGPESATTWQHDVNWSPAAPSRCSTTARSRRWKSSRAACCSRPARRRRPSSSSRPSRTPLKTLLAESQGSMTAPSGGNGSLGYGGSRT